MLPPPPANPSPTGRFPIVDAARGVALAAMVVFHAAWDLSFLRLIATPVGTDPAWQAFAMAIAASFLTLVGVGLVLAHGDGIRRGAFLRRLGIVSLAAAGVTGATLVAFPDAFIYFGILHMIAVGSVLALPFLRAPLWLVGAAAAGALLLPQFVRSPAFDGRWLAWTGLAEQAPPTNDFEPVFPWLAPVLVGVALARLALGSPWWRERLAGWQPRSGLGRGLAAAGRRSLPIYLVHQPILLALLMPVAWLLGPNPAALTGGFERSCAATCEAGGRSGEACRRTCACVLERATAQGLRQALVTDALTPDELASVRATAQACFREAGG